MPQKHTCCTQFGDKKGTACKLLLYMLKIPNSNPVKPIDIDSQKTRPSSNIFYNKLKQH